MQHPLGAQAAATAPDVDTPLLQNTVDAAAVADQTSMAGGGAQEETALPAGQGGGGVPAAVPAPDAAADQVPVDANAEGDDL